MPYHLIQQPGSSPIDGTYISEVHGLIDALETDGDPEYEWVDRIRAPRATNEARLARLRRMANGLRRRIGNKCMAMGGNAVLGYNLVYDMEEATTGMIVVRASGTACTLHDVQTEQP